MAMNYGQGNPYTGMSYEQLRAELDRANQTAGILDKRKMDQQYKLGKAEIDAAMQRAKISSKDTRYGIEMERDAARERIAQAREDMERIGIPRMEIERYVAEKHYEIAQSELAFKREELTQTTQSKREQLQLDREEMERVGIPRVEIERYTAQKQAEIAQQEFAENQRQFNQTYGEQQRQFNVGATGYVTQPGQLGAAQQAQLAQLQARDAQLKAAGFAEGLAHDGPEAINLLYQLQDQASGVTAGPGGGGQMATLDREKFAADEAERARRFSLDVGKFGAQLASTPDTYYQSRRFQGMDIPRLMGGAGAPTTPVYGGPTPQIQTMGAYLSGQDPAQVGYPQAAGGAAGPDQLMGTADDRAKQIAAISKASPPSPFDGLTEQDAASLRLMQSIYAKGGQAVAGGEMERLKASGRMGYMQSAGRLLGYDPSEFEAQYSSYRPAQGASNLA